MQYVGFALFLLLGFRVNESHQRYLDGLKVWTKIAGTVGSISKYFILAFPPGVFHQGDRERMLGWLVAFPVALKRELREQRDLSELKTILAPEDLSELQHAPEMANHTLYVLSAYIMKARHMERRFPQTFLVHLINWVADLESCADLCMQIKRMPCGKCNGDLIHDSFTNSHCFSVLVCCSSSHISSNLVSFVTVYDR